MGKITDSYCINGYCAISHQAYRDFVSGTQPKTLKDILGYTLDDPVDNNLHKEIRLALVRLYQERPRDTEIFLRKLEGGVYP
jgi:hypothetical protein